MKVVRIEIVRVTDHSFPGWVECCLIDVHGRHWSFIEKVPIVLKSYLDDATSCPQSGVIACEVISRRREADGREVVTIDTARPWHVEATGGETRFEVGAEQLIDID